MLWNPKPPLTRCAVYFRYSVLSREVPKYTKLTDKCVIATSGMGADKDALHKVSLCAVALPQTVYFRCRCLRPGW